MSIKPIHEDTKEVVHVPMIKRNLRTAKSREFWKDHPERPKKTSSNPFEGLPYLGDYIWNK